MTLHHSHDYVLILLSVLIAIFASYTALDLANSVTVAHGRARLAWLLGGSLAMGVGIWSMHFVGMLAFSLPGIPIAYDISLIILSVMVAVAASAMALFIVSREKVTNLALALGSLAMGAAIAGMHYIGIASMRIAATWKWDFTLVALSIVIAVIASFAALLLAFRLRGNTSWVGFFYRASGGFVMGVAISGMHYTAMAAMSFFATEPKGLQEQQVLATSGLAIAVVGTTLVILAIALTGSIVDRALARKQALLKVMQENENQFRNLANSISQLAWTANADGWIYWYNDRWYDYTGTSLEEMQGWGWEKVHHPHHVERVVSFVKEAWKKSEPWELTFPLRSKTGEWRWFLTRAVPVLDSAGAITRWFGTNTDIQERKEAEEKIELLHMQAERARQELYEFFMQAPAPMVVLLGPEHRFSLANPPYERFVARKVVGKAVYEVFTKEEVGSFVEKLDHVYQSGQPYIGNELPLVLPNESGEITHRFINVGYHPFRESDGTIKGVLAFHQDVTDQVLARKEAEKLAADLKEAVRVRDEFLSIASHELKTPLTPIKLQLQGLGLLVKTGRIEKLTPERVKKVVENSDRQLVRLTSLIEDLLDVSRITSGRLTLNPETQDIIEVIRESCERYSQQALSSGTAFVIDVPVSLRATFDRLRIEQVIINLLTNAMKYAPEKPVHISASKTNLCIQVSVRDEGTGIPQESLLKVFDRFERVQSTNNIGGLGLGLYISRQIIQAHGGRIWAESPVGQGAKFTFEIPIEYDRKQLPSTY